MQDKQNKIVLITGAAKRIGAAITQYLHARHCRVVIHYHNSIDAAKALCEKLNTQREDSAMLVQADLREVSSLTPMIAAIQKKWGGLDVLINNAAAFAKTNLSDLTEDNWNNLININLKAPFFLSQAAANALEKNCGCIVNIADVHGVRPMKEYPIYSISKAGLLMLTKSLAKEFGSKIRVNAVSPSGGIAWPQGENTVDEKNKKAIIARSILKKEGQPVDVAKAVGYFIFDADFVTGQVLAVDGGRSLRI